MKSFHIILLSVVLLFQGCNTNDDLQEQEGNGNTPGTEVPGTEDPDPESPDPETPEVTEPGSILLRGKGLESRVITRAVSDFPNHQEIGVITAEYTGGTTDWTSYADIDNTTATATRQDTDGIFYFSWPGGDIKYYPFDGSQLVFLAYSPPANNSTVVLDADRQGLELTLTDTDMPDVLYATDSVAVPHSKLDSLVNLGEFRHALSKITIQFVGNDTVNPDIRLEELVLKNAYKSAHLDLLAGDNGLSLHPVDTFTYTLINQTTDFISNSFSQDLFLFPGTQDETTLRVKLSDGYFEFDSIYPISSFKNLTTSGPITFERGVHTILTFTVIGTTVQQPDNLIVLLGQLTDWEDQGNYMIGIK